MPRTTQTIIERVASRSAGPETDAAEFARLMKEEWTRVEYNEKADAGSLHYPGLGQISFKSSGSDPAVVVTVRGPIRLKDSPENVASALEKIHKLLTDVGL